MRVMLVVHGFPPGASGGTEIYAHDLAMELNHQFDDEVVVLSREADPRLDELSVRWERRNGVRVAFINNTLKACRSFEQTYRHDGVRQAAADLMDEVEPEVVHFHHLTGLSTDLVSETHRRRVPSLFTLHDYWLICQRGQLLDLEMQRCAGPSPERCARCVGNAAGAGPATFHGASVLRELEGQLPMAGTLARELGRRLSSVWTTRSAALEQMTRRTDHIRKICDKVTRFLAPSRTLLGQFLDFGVPRQQIQLAELGIDHNPYMGLERQGDEGPLQIGFVGSLVPSKGPHLLLEAFSRLPKDQATLRLFGSHLPYHGDDSYRHRLEPLLRQDGVLHHGAIPHGEIPRLLLDLDLLVVPSTWLENAPLVVKEAFLAGVPVVASRLGGMAEAVQEGHNGLLFEPGDAADLGRVLGRVLNEPDLLPRLRRGIPKVRSLAEDARALRNIYQESVPTKRQWQARSDLGHALPAASAEIKANIAALVLNYGTPEETVNAVRALQSSRRPLDQIIVVDNGSPDDSEEQLRATLEPEGITVIETGENLGFSGGNNVGIRLALRQGADQVLLVNSDVTLEPGCVGNMELAMARNPDFGIAGPRILARSARHIVASLGIKFSPTTGRMHHLGFGQNVGECQIPPVATVDGVSGCAMLIRREVLQEVGLLDEDYFFSFEDLDLCLRAKRRGYLTVCIGRATAFHEGGQSIGKHSPRRIYFATRNHLLMARTSARIAPPLTMMRHSFILGLNLAHVMLTSDIPRSEGLGAMASGVWHHIWRRYGDGP